MIHGAYDAVLQCNDKKNNSNICYKMASGIICASFGEVEKLLDLKVVFRNLGLQKQVLLSASYVPNFIDDNEEEELMRHVSSCPLPKQTQLSKRRLQNWDGIPHQKGKITEEIPKIFRFKYLLLQLKSHTLLEVTERLDTEEDPRQLKPEFSFLLQQRSLLVLQHTLDHDYLHSISGYNCDTIDSNYIRNLNLCSYICEESEKLNHKTRISLTIRHVPKISKLKLQFEFSTFFNIKLTIFSIDVILTKPIN
ncbi:Similar to alkbh6: Alpha-ketoglutarate-dependent dioxygenase alkB homolog 6 (Danio rerio) [Cotesia congregata]|uniref:Similar to alkbh6: Alpha-ketoglutarate-dependent dioxygenase alkB homolog 6 (Danio rerio) n=1 Tax=Cotesia congregata TaxID=51543 RepID=A0A8J2HJX6_COTCN|nr:Similar to alkbh6: Alpha-ketoglutarate-dependent dioxygenase alkB homolog 6 (Danio rerio) [Cotesia congregata]